MMTALDSALELRTPASISDGDLFHPHDSDIPVNANFIVRDLKAIAPAFVDSYEVDVVATLAWGISERILAIAILTMRTRSYVLAHILRPIAVRIPDQSTLVTYRGNRGVELNKSNFDKLADVLYSDCGWEAWEIDSRLKHYEGTEGHDWA
jgi:hypothetical protein